MPINYSIVICTYNPDERLLDRCLKAVRNLISTDISYEVILVDNNSRTPVKELSCVTGNIGNFEHFSLLHVAEQGVGFARMAAIGQAKGEYVIYFDYDNEPKSDYLQELKKLNAQYPKVAVVGPGNVWVDFVDGIDQEIEEYARIAFQEKHQGQFSFSNQKEWQDVYPFGTGMCAKTSVLQEYVKEVRAGKYTMRGRIGGKLSGGEDTQMVLHCLKRGFFAGSSPALCLIHMIPGHRANKDYLKKLAYNTSFDYQTCVLQVFPEQRVSIKKSYISGGRFVRKSVKKFLTTMFSSDYTRLFKLARFIGYHEGVYRALNKPVPGLVKLIVRFLKLTSN